MKNKKNLIIVGSVIAVIVIGLIIYFAFANNSADDTKDVATKSSAQALDDEVEIVDDEKAVSDDASEDDPVEDETESDDEKSDDKKSDDKKSDDKKSDDKKSDDKKSDDKKSDDKKSDDKKSDDKKSDDKKSDKTEEMKLPEPAEVPAAQSVETKDVVEVPEKKEDTKYQNADIYTNKDGQLAAKTDSGKEVEFTGDYMQKLFDEYEKVKGKDAKREKEILDELQLIMSNHEVMELEEEE